MTRIKIPFNKWSLERLLDERKTATSRNKCYGERNDVFIIRNKIFRITNIRQLKLITIATYCFKDEGCETPEEFINVWKSIHPRLGWTPDKRVWIHYFTYVEDVKP